MDKKVRIVCQGASKLPLHKMTIIQGDLKSLSEKNYNKLKDQMLTDGFIDPFRVWKGKDEHKGKNCILDGTQRFRVLSKLKEEGYEIPELPVDWLEAENYNKAKRLLLSLASQYGRIDKQGLYEFVMDTDLTLEELDAYSFPEIKIEKFKMEYYEELQEKQIPYITDHDKQYIVAVECKGEEEMNKLYSELKKRDFECKLIT